MVPRFFPLWTKNLTKSEAAGFLAAWSLWEAREEAILLWPDEPADSIWILESGQLIVVKKSGGKVLQKSLIAPRPTPCALIKSSEPSNILLRASRGSRVWRLEKKRLIEWKMRHPRTFEKLAQPGGPLQDLADWNPPLPPRPLTRRLVFHPPAIFYLGWIGLSLAFVLPGVALLVQGLQGGWLAIALASLIFMERTLSWFGDFLELRPDRLVYVKTDLIRRQSRRWSARWSDLQNIEVAQTGWLAKALDLVNLKLSTRSFGQDLGLKNWNGKVAEMIRQGRPAPIEPQPEGGLRALWGRLYPNTVPLVCIHPPPRPTPATRSTEFQRFPRHPFTWLLRTSRGLAGLAGGGLVMGLGLASQALVLLAAGLALGGFGFSVLIWEWWDWVNDTYALENGKLVDVERRPFWLGSLRREIPLASLQSVEVEQKGLLPILFDYGVVRLSSAGGGPGLDWIDLARPSEVHELLFELKREEENRLREAQQAAQLSEVTSTVKTFDELKSWGLGIQ